MNDLEDARRYVDEGLELDGSSDFYMRLLACKALVLLKEGRRDEGLEALRTYYDRYKNYYPMRSREDVERMVHHGGGGPFPPGKTARRRR